MNIKKVILIVLGIWLFIICLGFIVGINTAHAEGYITSHTTGSHAYQSGAPDMVSPTLNKVIITSRYSTFTIRGYTYIPLYAPHRHHSPDNRADEFKGYCDKDGIKPGETVYDVIKQFDNRHKRK